VYDLFERSIPQWARDSLACASGCGFCCYQTVALSPPEVFFLARLIAEEPSSVAAVRDTAAKLDGRSAGAPGAFWLKCPLLDQASNCSAYAARPLACRSYVSLNVNDCRTVYLQPGNSNVHAPAPYEDLKRSCRTILMAALRLNGLPTAQHELNAAVRVVLDTQNAEKRWLRGENIFAGLPELAPNLPETERILAMLAKQVGPTL
jgi:Fe-S-cluster containining protein